MKVRASIRKMCKFCKVVTRRNAKKAIKKYIICSNDQRHKQSQR